MKTLIITQRYEKIGRHHELRDNLDVRFIKLIEKIGYKQVLMPNEVLNPKKFITNIMPKIQNSVSLTSLKTRTKHHVGFPIQNRLN